MPRFEPFKGLRYAPRLAPIGEVMAPPYDVIGSAERVHLAARHPANAVLVELPEPDLQAGLDRYKVATELFSRWQSSGILLTDPEPSLYPYRMTDPSGRSSTGVMGALGLADPGQESDILPHEQTLPKPKSDRLDLLRATRANLSPIWGLSMAPGLTATFDPTDDEPVADAYDDDGVRHQLWVLNDQDSIAAIAAAVAQAPVVIADGHHRYETARAYQAECRAANGDQPGPHDLVLALIVELAEDQLTVGAIHRTISGLPDDLDLTEALSPWFDVVRAGAADERTLGALADSSSLALVTGGAAYLLLPRAEAYEEAGNDLDSSLIAMALSHLPPHESTHRHSVAEATEALESGQAQAAFLLRPVTVAQIEEWAGARRRMPPKTTYFSPKPRTGMVFRSLDA
ncbi:MAG TPA: DUF1015 domain-containing protein [Acidimicrobiales bacterium]|jgi:uncharacterized protein (DUF1015 family)|nr:DUF1015 domain-containing protein [Acidimicrobiales bacterium]